MDLLATLTREICYLATCAGEKVMRFYEEELLRADQLEGSGAYGKAVGWFCGRRADALRPLVVASKDHAGPLVERMLTRLTSPRLQSMGSALKFCLVAEGKADIYLRDLPIMEWDTAAAECIVEAVGGGVYSLDGKPLGYGKPGLKNSAIMTVGDQV